MRLALLGSISSGSAGHRETGGTVTQGPADGPEWFSRIIDEAFTGRARFAGVRGGDALAGGLSELVLLQIDLLEPSQKSQAATVVLKMASEDEGASYIAELLQADNREHDFYSRARSLGEDVAPRCFASGLDPTSGRAWLLLEHVAGSTLPSQLHGASPETAERVARLLARLHASNLEPPQGSSRLGAGWSTSAMARLGPLTVDRFQAFAAKFGAEMSAYSLDVTRRLAGIYVDVLDDWERAKPMRLIHGDARLENVVCSADGSMRLIDWQMASLGEGAFDLGHFLAGSLTIDGRRGAERGVVTAYVQELRILGEQVSEEEVWHDVRRTMLLTLPLQVVFATTPTDSTELATARLEVVRRYATAVDDFRSGDFIA